MCSTIDRHAQIDGELSILPRQCERAAWTFQKCKSFFCCLQHHKKGFKKADTDARNKLQSECIFKMRQGVSNDIVDTGDMENVSISLALDKGSDGADECHIVRGGGFEGVSYVDSVLVVCVHNQT